jgi:hypothetical protein
MRSRNSLSKIRKVQGLLVQDAGAETLLYNEQTHQAFCLSPLAAQVWQRLDGIQTPPEIAAAASLTLGTPVTSEMVLFAVGELQRDGLLERDASAAAIDLPSRRDLMRQAAAGALVMLPVVAVVMAPRAAQAYTGCFDCDVQPINADALQDSVKPRQLTPQQEVALQRRTAAKRTHEGGSPTLFVP